MHVHDFLPAHKLAGLIAASVIHGGEGTVQTACASGARFAGIGLQARGEPAVLSHRAWIDRVHLRIDAIRQ
ncbi:hypothetical protein [Parenemella sanctibonifatiensis]|uniref:hypothetical protein n=1 Tax=Parenemella sanctibonifatiensis TaxID=2016505 RepID=UPI001E5FC9EE|nr:hypothetical protein [Parenemella sanctibonifatiensis]